MNVIGEPIDEKGELSKKPSISCPFIEKLLLLLSKKLNSRFLFFYYNLKMPYLLYFYEKALDSLEESANRGIANFRVFILQYKVWVAYKESSWICSVVWVVLLICFGSITTCFYIVWQLFQISCQDPAYLILVHRGVKQVAKQNDDKSCGYYVMINMMTIVSTTITNNWKKVFNASDPFTSKELKYIREVWTEFFLRLYEERKPVGKEERRKRIK